MAIYKNGLIIVLFLATLCILETGLIKFSGLVSQIHAEEEPIIREKRQAAPSPYDEYDIFIELNVTSAETVDYLRSLLNNSSVSLSLDPNTNLTHIDITKVCYFNGSNYQCRCEEDFVWPNDTCRTYQACDEIVNDTCTCVNDIPPDGHYCLPKTEPLFENEYIISIELNTTDMSVINLLKDILRNITYPIDINSYTKISDVNMTTVCSPSSDSFQCICEDQYRWPCDQCFLYGSCDNLTNDTCGCINAIPPGGQHCQSVDQYNFTVCPSTTTFPTPTPFPITHEYILSIELNTTDMTVINLIRNILRNTSYPISIYSFSKISDISLTTVCSPSSDGFQCICEDQYRWSCDQCVLHGSCDNVTNDTCGCINAIPPGGQYCQSADQHNFTVCPYTTTIPTTAFPTTPFPLNHEYILSIELSATDLTVTNLLREILRNTSYPIGINSYSKISEINLTTVCSPSSAGFQCICEDQYHWPCDQCLLHGPCDNITNDTCRCIEAIPLGGLYCQSVDQHISSVCPTTTTFPTTMYTTMVSTTVSFGTPVTNMTTEEPPTTVTDMTTEAPPPTVTNTTTPAPTTETNTTTPAPTTIVTLAPLPITNVTTPAPTTNTTTPAPPPPVTNTTSPRQTTVTNTTTQAPQTVRRTSTKATSTTASTTTTTVMTTKATTTTTAATTDQKQVLQINMSITFDKEYTPELADESSSVHNELQSQVQTVLLEQYRTLTDFVDVSVTGFRPGSVITDFVVKTLQVNEEEFIAVNQKLPDAMRPVANVIGSITALYISPTKIIPPPVTYTSQSFTLKCGPTSNNLDLGSISKVIWKLNGQKIKASGRFEIQTQGTVSKLTITNVILADSGIYECNMVSSVITFAQKGLVTNIKQAPNVRVRSQINVKCVEEGSQAIQCCVQPNYIVKWFRGTTVLISDEKVDEESYCILYRHSLRGCRNSETQKLLFTCRVNDPIGFGEDTTIITFNANVVCNDALYGTGRLNDISTIPCEPGQEGSRSSICRETGKWDLYEDDCILTEIKDLVTISEDLVEDEVPQLAAHLSEIVQKEKQQIANSSATISAIVGILSNIANVSNEVNKTVMENVLKTVDVIIGDDARESWEFLRANVTRNETSELIGSMETLGGDLVGEFTINTEIIRLKRETFNNPFMAGFNSSVVIDIPNTDTNNFIITTMVFSTLDNVLPPRNASFTNNESISFNDTINAEVVLVRTNAEVRNINLSFKKQNNSLTNNPQCVFWSFSLFNNFGAWDNEGCMLVSDNNDIVTCHCDHLTSFSILMSTGVPESIQVALDIITYIGVGISIASLVLTLIIEAYVWKTLTRNSTAFMRHLCIVNTALSLLIADICFIIAASYAKNPLENPGEDHKVPLGPCTTATFFMHFFYLALFFWMLASGLLLFYRTVMVFSQMSKSAMMAIGFFFGYVCPLIIAVVTVAATAPGKGYIKENDACWLNWVKTKALLALVIPALTIVFINILIVIVIMFKMLRRGVGEVIIVDERHTLLVILRCVIILTPLFGLTWSLGVGTMISATNKGIHIAFAFFNSLQGFFILVFGILLDSKIRAVLAKKLPVSSSGSGSNQTASTSGGVSSSSGLKWLKKIRGKRYIYRVSDAANSSSSNGYQSYSNM